MICNKEFCWQRMILEFTFFFTSHKHAVREEKDKKVRYGAFLQKKKEIILLSIVSRRSNFCYSTEAERCIIKSTFVGRNRREFSILRSTHIQQTLFAILSMAAFCSMLPMQTSPILIAL
jgi:hypothetical protein